MSPRSRWNAPETRRYDRNTSFARNRVSHQPNQGLTDLEHDRDTPFERNRVSAQPLCKLRPRSGRTGTRSPLMDFFDVPRDVQSLKD